MKLRSLLVVWLALSSGCTRAAPRQDATTIVVNGSSGSTLVTSGVRIEIADSVAYALHSITSNGPESRHESLNGHPFGIRAGLFYIGDVEYGSVHAGSVVKVSGAGIVIDGEPRGPVPAAVGAEK